MTTVIAVCDGVFTNNIEQGHPDLNFAGCSVPWSSAVYLPPFDVSQLDPATVAEAFAAGFTIAGAPMLLILGFRVFIQPIWKKT